jgi:hypothetical protein
MLLSKWYHALMKVKYTIFLGLSIVFRFIALLLHVWNNLVSVLGQETGYSN